MDITITRIGETVAIAACGRLDTVTSPELASAVDAAVAESPRRLELDFAGVGYISSTGLRVLLAAAKAMAANGGEFALCGVQGEVLKVLTLTGFADIIPIEDCAQDG